MPSLRLAREAELLHAVEQGRASEAEARRGALRAPDYPMGFSDDPEDVFAFDLFEGADPGRRAFSRSAPRQLVQCQTKGWPGRQDDGPGDDVLQLPHIARPIIVHEGVQRLGGEHVERLVQVPGVVAHEVMYQQGNIFQPVAQRRNRHGKTIQAVVEIGAEVPGVHHLRQLSIGRRHQAHIHLPGASGG
jgi:hypothetical protein